MNSEENLLVTGASGLLGWRALNYFNGEFITRGLYNSHKLAAFDAVLDRCDIRDKSSSAAYLEDFKPRVIINCAAHTVIDSAEKDRDACRDINVEALKPFLEYSAKTSAHFIHVSTDAFFSLQPGESATETTEPTPLNYYSETKLEAENLIKEADISSTIVRTNIFGWNMQPKMCLSEWIVDGLVRGEVRNLFEDVQFSPILTSRLVRAFGEIIRSKTFGLFNVAGSEQISKFEFGIRLADVFGLQNEVIQRSTLGNASLAAPRSNNMTLDSSKFFAKFPELAVSLNQDLIEYRNEMIYIDPRWIAHHDMGSLRTQYSV